MRQPQRTTRPLALGGVVLLVALGCGTVKSPTEPQGTNNAVAATNFQFTPSQLTIHVGETVTWTNQGGFHNVVADDGSFRCAAGCDGNGGNGSPASSWTFSRTFTTPGTVRYYCEVHGGRGGAGMSGTILVQAAAP